MRASPTYQPLADTTHDNVILVDERDCEIGIMPKLDAHRHGRRHRAISVLTRDAAGRLLLQQRAAGKYHSGGLWSNTCCSHPRPGEPASCAAKRRLREEMGVVAELRPLFSTHYRARVSEGLIEDEFVHVFGGVFDAVPNPNAAEVAGWCWKSLAETKHDICERPQTYTIWFRQFLEEFEQEITQFASA
jgi:isopentenyl-diphosphate delta-isomerase